MKKITYNKETCEIKYGDEVIADWNDEAHYDYPEDLIWRRDISRLVNKVFEAGYKAGKNDQITKEDLLAAVHKYTFGDVYEKELLEELGFEL